MKDLTQNTDASSSSVRNVNLCHFTALHWDEEWEGKGREGKGGEEAKGEPGEGE